MDKNNDFDLIIRSGQCIISDPLNPFLLQQKKCDIGIKNSRITAIEDQILGSKAPIWDASQLTVLPGIIDSQVHFRDPGAPDKEDFSTGSLGAVLGGITAVFDMPNTKPNTSTVKNFQDKLTEVSSKSYCDFGLFAGATNDNSAELLEMEKMIGCCGFKIFMGSSTGDLLVSEDEFLKNVLRTGTKMISVHCEDEKRLVERKKIAIEKANPAAHPEWRDVQSALLATQRIVKMAEEIGRRVHILHVTTSEEIEFLKNKKNIATIEILPQHLFFSSPDCYEKLGSFAQMNPPIRELRHQQALRKALQEKVISIVASDHAPHTKEEKQRTYPDSPSGLTGVQTILPLMLNFVNEGLLDIFYLTQLMSINPAQLFKAKGKGGIYIGQDADFTIVDMNKKQTFTHEQMATRCGWTPYDGVTVKGFPVATIIRGHIVMENGKVLSPPQGSPISF